MAAPRDAGGDAVRAPAFTLGERLAIYPRIHQDEWLDPAIATTSARDMGSTCRRLSREPRSTGATRRRNRGDTRSSALLDKASPAVRAALEAQSLPRGTDAEEGLLLYTSRQATICARR